MQIGAGQTEAMGMYFIKQVAHWVWEFEGASPSHGLSE